MADRALIGLVTLVALLMLFMGVQWIVMPASIASDLGMDLLQGLGRSTQIGDMMSFFVCAGCFALLGLVTRNAAWFYASAMLLGFTAMGRTLAWILHDASFAVPQIPAEVVMAIILLVAARRLARAG